MAENFYTIVTAIGKAKIANSYALGTKLNLAQFKVGDGGGVYYNPTEDQTLLRNQVWSGNISSIYVDDNNPNWIVVEVVIPATDGGFMIREAAIFDDTGNMIAIGKYPETYKPLLEDGSAKDLYIKMILEVSNTSSITLKIDPSVVLATKKDITILQNQINALLTDKLNKTVFDNFQAGITAQLASLLVSPALFEQDTDPGSNAKVKDIWLDTANNIFKRKIADGTWVPVGATYN
jgi:phage-related tail fiber protein